MEQRPRPRAEALPCRPRCTRADVRRHGGPPHPLPLRHQGPARARARATATRRARSRSTRCPRTGSSTSASTATTCGCSTTARARTCRRATRSSPSTTSRCATGRRRSTSVRRETGADTRPGAWATASAACRCSWRSAAGWRACARRRFSALAGHPIPTPGNRLRARRADGDDDQGARDQGPQQRLRPRSWDGRRSRRVMRSAALPARLRQPGRAPDLLRVRRRLPLREHQPRDDGAARCRASSATAT